MFLIDPNIRWWSVDVGFPTDIQLNLEELLKLVKQVADAEANTKDFIAGLEENRPGAKFEAKNVPEFSQPGVYKASKQTLEFYDRTRDRAIRQGHHLAQAHDGAIG